ncbi:MAG: hypothetical protein FVQ84_14935 [Planctomycetes bacterium]|nr:hypothetical protein [Planctomycetota bacterium]
MTNEMILEATTKELNRLRTPKLWITARGLSHLIRRKYPELCNLSQVRLFDVLSEHMESPGRPRKIRNSRYPSAKTIEVLWGAIDDCTSSAKVRQKVH